MIANFSFFYKAPSLVKVVHHVVRATTVTSERRDSQAACQARQVFPQSSVVFSSDIVPELLSDINRLAEKRIMMQIDEWKSIALYDTPADSVRVQGNILGNEIKPQHRIIHRFGGALKFGTQLRMHFWSYLPTLASIQKSDFLREIDGDAVRENIAQ